VRVTSTYLKKAQPQSEGAAADVAATVSEIIKDVRADGDAAVRRYSEKFDKWNPPSFKLDQEPIDKAIASLPAVVIDDLKFAQHVLRRQGHRYQSRAAYPRGGQVQRRPVGWEVPEDLHLPGSARSGVERTPGGGMRPGGTGRTEGHARAADLRAAGSAAGALPWLAPVVQAAQ
jgi:hypothetical protein